MSLLEWGGSGSAKLRERLEDVAPEDVAATIIGFEEQMRGWMTYIARAKSMPQQLSVPAIAAATGKLPTSSGGRLRRGSTC